MNWKNILLGAAVAAGGCCLAGLLALLFGTLIMDYEFGIEVIWLSCLITAMVALLQVAAWFVTRKASLRIRIVVAAITAVSGVALAGGCELYGSSLKEPLGYVYGCSAEGRSLAPKSVQLLHARRSGIWGNVYLHFRCEPEDIKSCVLVGVLGVRDGPPTEENTRESHSPFRWWRPWAMKSPRVYSLYSRGGIGRHLWVNEEHTEAYFVAFHFPISGLD